MNWTEGSLACHSRRRRLDDEAARQRRHFARAWARRPVFGSGGPPRPPEACGVAGFGLDSLAAAPQAQPDLAVPVEGVVDDDDAGSPSLGQRRARLLEKRDWAGIEDPAAQRHHHQPERTEHLHSEGSLAGAGSRPETPDAPVGEDLAPDFYGRSGKRIRVDEHGYKSIVGASSVLDTRHAPLAASSRPLASAEE